MKFFEPALTPPEPSRHEWAPPAWDRPSEGTIPWSVPVNAIVHRTDDAVVRIDTVSAYPNGFVINLEIRANPHRSHHEIMGRIHLSGMRFPRVGVRFANGETAGREAGPGRGHGPTPMIPKDVEGFPTTPVVRLGGGGGGGHGWHFGVWVYPLPPEGPLEVYVSMPVAGLDEGMVVVDAGPIRAGAERAVVVWT